MTRSALLKTLFPVVIVTLVPFACSVKGVEPLAQRPPKGDAGGGDDTLDPTGSGGGGDVPQNPGNPGEPECPYEGPPPVNVDSLEPCPSCTVGGAHCLPSSLVPADFQSQLAACEPGQLCVPDAFIETNGQFIPATCESVAGAEGRCLSPCLPQVAEQAANLPRSSCAATELCVPCYDPQSGEATGACELSCDPGPGEPPVLLPACCESEGVSYGTCVPKSAAGDQADRLGPDSCPQGGGELVCAPNEYIEDQSYQAPDCDDFFRAFTFGAEYGPGKCLSNCIPEVADAPLTGAGDCEGENVKCVPCISPLDGESTGACDP